MLDRSKACAKNAMAKGRAAAKEWAAAARSQGAKLAHRRTARIGAKPQLAEEVINGTSHFFTPLDMVASRFNTWAAKWQNTHKATQDDVTAIQEVRTCAKASQALPKITLKDLDDALATMNEAIGMGAERFDPRFIKALLETGRRPRVVEEVDVEVERQCRMGAVAGFRGGFALVGAFARWSAFFRASKVGFLFFSGSFFWYGTTEGIVFGRQVHRDLQFL